MRPSNLADPPKAVDWIVTTGSVDGIEVERLVGRLWDLGAIAAEAHRLRAEMATLRDDSDWDDHASIPALFTSSAAVVRFLRHEPLLPAELTPADWPVELVRSTYDRFEAGHQRLLQRFLRSP